MNLPFGNSLTFVLTTRLSRSSSAYAAEASPRRLCVQLLSSYVMTRVVGPGRDLISRSTLRTCRERLPTAGAAEIHPWNPRRDAKDIGVGVFVQV